MPEPAAIPEPRRDYYHHNCISVPVPLSTFSEEDNKNRFRLKVSPEQDWGWPQHLVYGVHLRVYYDAAKKGSVRSALTGIENGATLGSEVRLAIDIPERKRRVNRVDYLGLYDGVNWEGDGLYRRWHYFYYHGQLTHHLGSSVTAPFNQLWDTTWLPNQSEPLQLAARIVDDTGLIYFTQPVAGLKLERPGLDVELCKPTNVPDNWVTRNDPYEETVTIAGDLSKAKAARLVWSSWSPGYMNGLFVNGSKVLQAEGPNYRYYDHVVDLKDLSVLRQGENTISTGKTPLHDGKMVHGMEVNWPGIQLLIQFREAR
ncbi:MAG: hypothetical protein ACI9R3_003262 [Verrucomicrobiales bacterium]